MYSARHLDPNMFYEDMIMMSIYYNSPFLAENQKYGVLNFFRDKGFQGYCMRDPTEKDMKRKLKNYGLPTTGNDMRNLLINQGKSFVMENVGYFPETNSYGRLDFRGLIKDMLKFDATNWTPHDDTVAFMIALCATMEQAQSIGSPMSRIKKWIPKY